MKILRIGYLYGDLMNIYGDTGNITVLKKRAEWRGIEVKIVNITIGKDLRQNEIDVYFFGGGQDFGQQTVGRDIQHKAGVLKSDVEKGVPLLSICGGYQLLGEYYLPSEGEKIPGIGLFKAYTVASAVRMIGNIVVESEFGQLVGFENHSGKTFLEEGAQPFGKVIKGFGNNGEDGSEGCRYKNAIGCYMHGSLLPKNPVLADWLLKTALQIKYKEEIDLERLDDELEEKAHKAAVSKFT